MDKYKVSVPQIKRKHNNERAGSRMKYTYKACAADRESRDYIDPRKVYVPGSKYKQKRRKNESL